MKAFLIAGAVLMAGASIYGFIDYKKTSRNTEFTKMYKSEGPATVTETTKPVIDMKNDATKKEVSKTDESVVSKTEKVVTRMSGKKKKVVSYKLFSRAALEEKYINKDVKKESKTGKE